jgi:hypothetical protein
MSQLKYYIHHWGPCVVKTTIDQDMIDLFLKEGEASKEDASPDLAGVLDKQIHFRDKSKFNTFFAGIFNLYNHAMNQWKKEKPNDKPPTYYLERLWINYQGPNEFNPPHSHGGTLSFAIFLDVPMKLRVENQEYKGKSAGPGGLTFLYGDNDDHCISYHSIFPAAGDMFIFPAWLKHWVYPFKSDVTRISVSGNVIDKVELNKLKSKYNGK